MIKRFYKSCISLQFAVSLIVNALVVFLFAFLTFRTENKVFYWIGLVAGCILILQMLYTEFRKQKVAGQLRGIRDIEAYYGEGSMIGRSFVLPERLLACDENLHLQEIPVKGISSCSVSSLKKEKQRILLETPHGEVALYSDNALQSSRLAGFLLKQNPDMQIQGTEPSGDGSFQSLSK